MTTLCEEREGDPNIVAFVTVPLHTFAWAAPFHRPAVVDIWSYIPCMQQWAF